MKSICVFCGSSDGNDPLITKAAIALADALLERNNHLMNGGVKFVLGAPLLKELSMVEAV